MAGRLTNTDTMAILNNRFGGSAMPAAPTYYYIGLSTTAPNPDGTGVTEVVIGGATPNGYARVALQNIAANWTAGSRSKSNAVPVTFPTASIGWGVITHFLMWDASTGGALRAYGLLDAPVDILAGETRSFPVGAMIVAAPGT